jgi:dihydrolipoamide dehydrogenase
MRQWKSDVVNGLTGGLGRLVAQRKITHIRASAVFSDNLTLSLTDADGKESTLGFEHAILATGSHAAEIPIFPADSDRIWNSKKALDLETVPRTLLVVGGGYIGLELGSVYAALGSEVTVVEMLPHLLTGADRDLVRFLNKSLTERFKAILLKPPWRRRKSRKTASRSPSRAWKKSSEASCFSGCSWPWAAGPIPMRWLWKRPG